MLLVRSLRMIQMEMWAPNIPAAKMEPKQLLVRMITTASIPPLGRSRRVISVTLASMVLVYAKLTHIENHVSQKNFHVISASWLVVYPHCVLISHGKVYSHAPWNVTDFVLVQTCGSCCNLQGAVQKEGYTHAPKGIGQWQTSHPLSPGNIRWCNCVTAMCTTFHNQWSSGLWSSTSCCQWWGKYCFC